MDWNKYQQAVGVLDRALSRMDCKGITLVEARDVIAAMQFLTQFAPKQETIPAEASSKP